MNDSKMIENELMPTENSITSLQERFEELNCRFKECNKSFIDSYKQLYLLKLDNTQPLLDSSFYLCNLYFDLIKIVGYAEQLIEKKHTSFILGEFRWMGLSEISIEVSQKFEKTFKEFMKDLKIPEWHTQNVLAATNKHLQFWAKNGVLKDADLHRIYFLGLEIGEILLQISRKLEGIFNQIAEQNQEKKEIALG